MHPADEIRGIKSKKLSNKKIVLGVTGSIAAVETIKMSRELIRYGAEIIPVMSPNATNIIHPDALWFATGNKPITQLTGATEHISLCGRTKNQVDMLLICPCTANTLSKIAHGIDDTTVTTFATTALGSGIPILIVPAMHISMYDNPIIQKNIEKCKKTGIKFITPIIKKNKAKMVEIEEITSNVIRETGKNDFADKNVLIIGGPTSEPIDEARIITNKSSGKTAINLSKTAFFRGANVELWYGRGLEHMPEYIDKTSFDSIKEIIKLLETTSFKRYDIIILCAAISDYIPKKQNGKISSSKENLTIELIPAPKIISEIRKKAQNSKVIGFKLEENRKKISEKAKSLLNKNQLDLVVGNTISGFEKNENEIWIFDKKGKSTYKKGCKEELSDFILDSIIDQ
jgi:phosphopantothenoylcysteine decarboxylase/phosphopantothenate--cysteine ligase